MKAIVNGRILLPGAEVQGKALVYDKKIVGVMDEAAARAMADEVIDAMRRIGNEMPSNIKETSLGGLATSPTAQHCQ